MSAASAGTAPAPAPSPSPAPAPAPSLAPAPAPSPAPASAPAPAPAPTRVSGVPRILRGSSCEAAVITAAYSPRAATLTTSRHAGGVSSCHTAFISAGLLFDTACTALCTAGPKLSNIAVRTADTRSERADLGQRAVGDAR